MAASHWPIHFGVVASVTCSCRCSSTAGRARVHWVSSLWPDLLLEMCSSDATSNNFLPIVACPPVPKAMGWDRLKLEEVGVAGTHGGRGEDPKHRNLLLVLLLKYIRPSLSVAFFKSMT